VVAELSYPLHSLDVTQLQGHSSLFITAVDTNEEKSEAVKVDLHVDYSNLYASGLAEKIMIKLQKGEKTRFAGSESGKEFIANGANYCSIRLATTDAFEPDFIATQTEVSFMQRAKRNPENRSFHEVHLGDLVQCYDPDRTEILYRIVP
jgi:hypothetical protein